MCKDVMTVKKHFFIMFAIGFGCFFMVVSSGYNEGMRYQIARLMRESVSGDYTVTSSRFEMEAEPTPVQVPWDETIVDDGSLMERIESTDGVGEALGHLVLYASVMGADESANDFAYVIGCDLKKEERHAFATMVKIESAFPGGDGIYVSGKLAETLSLKPGDPVYLFLVGQDGMQVPCRFTLGGVFSGRGFPAVSEKLVYIDYGLLKKSVRMEEDRYSSLLVFADGEDRRLGPALREQLGKELSVVDSSVSGAFYGQIRATISFFSLLFNLLMYVTIFLFVYSVLVASMSDRRKEIGTMSALGVDKRAIFRILAGEGCLIGLVPAMIGSAAGEIALFFVSRIGIPACSDAMKYMFASDVLYFRVNHGILLYSVVAIGAISFAASILPVRSALALDPVVALKEDR